MAEGEDGAIEQPKIIDNSKHATPGAERLVNGQQQPQKSMGWKGKAAALVGIFGAATFAGSGHVDDFFDAGKDAAQNTVKTAQQLGDSPTSPIEFVGDKARDGVSEGADRVADRFREGVDPRPLHGEVQNEGKRYHVTFDMTQEDKPEARTGPSTGDRELSEEEIKKLNLNLAEGVEGVMVSGGTYNAREYGDKFVDKNGNKYGEWVETTVEDPETHEKRKVYVGMTLGTATELPKETVSFNAE